MKFHLLITFLFLGFTTCFAQQTDNYKYYIYGLSITTDANGEEILTWIHQKSDQAASDWYDPNYYTTYSITNSGEVQSNYDFGIQVTDTFGPNNQYFYGEYYSNSGFGFECGVRSSVFYSWGNETLTVLSPDNNFLYFDSWGTKYLNAPELNGFFVTSYDGSVFYTYATIDSALANNWNSLRDCIKPNYCEATYFSDSTYVPRKMVTALAQTEPFPYIYLDSKQNTFQLTRTSVNGDSSQVLKENLTNNFIERINEDLLFIREPDSYILDLNDLNEYPISSSYKLIQTNSSIKSADSFHVFNSEGVFITENRGKSFAQLFEVPFGVYEMVLFNNEFYALTRDELLFYRNEKFESLYTLNQTSVDDFSENESLTFKLNSVYPNPFNPTTTISFSLPQSSQVSIQLFDVNGRLVKDISQQIFSSGKHDVQVDASHLGSGTYWLLVKSNFGNQSKAITLIK
ncbi:MAG: T9SS type A sorting domain-containing protein [Ignavibacteria bacterium]|nr:T9SS type A sorting domain-containing protein [Ignavibacteria bacterium]